ncbi:MAG TPA: hypothetical protein VGQ83_21135 [Polyangia bacterium]|jgi:hypothetical protein
MPFPWLHPSIPTEYRKTFARKAEAVFVQELEERAALLQRLNYSKQDAAARLRANVRWEHEPRPAPSKLIERVDAIVDAVYARGGRPGGTPEP